MAKQDKGSRKAPRTHDPKWKDSTRTARSDKRKAEMQAAAIRDGFTDTPESRAWSKAITAWKNGEYIMVKNLNDASNNH